MLYVADAPVCGECDDKRSQDTKRQRPAAKSSPIAVSGGCRECARLKADYDRLAINLDLTITRMCGVWDRSEYVERRHEAEEARLDARLAWTELEKHQRLHAEAKHQRARAVAI
jgi:hypothetical protein